MKETKEDLSKWRDALCLRIGILNIVNISVLPNWTYRFNTVPLKISAASFVDINKLILKFIWKVKGLRADNAVLMKNQVRGLTPTNFRAYYIAPTTNTVQGE